MTKQNRTLTPGVIPQVFFFIIVVPFFPLLISWRLDWWEAWVYAIISILGFVVNRVLSSRRHPDLPAERARMLRHEDAESWDKVLSPLVGLGGVLIVGTNLEDSKLQRKLEGYKDYAQLVCYRLVPGVW